MIPPIPKCVVIDGYPFVSAGFSRLWEGRIDVVGSAHDAPGGVSTAISHEPEDPETPYVVTIGHEMSGSCWWAIEEIVGKTRARVIMITGGRYEGLVDRVLAAGGHGIAGKNCHEDAILSAVRVVAAGGEFWGKTWCERQQAIEQSGKLDPAATLSDQDRQLIHALAADLTPAEIGYLWRVSERIIKRRVEELRAAFLVSKNEAIPLHAVARDVLSKAELRGTLGYA